MTYVNFWNFPPFPFFRSIGGPFGQIVPTTDVSRRGYRGSVVILFASRSRAIQSEQPLVSRAAGESRSVGGMFQRFSPRRRVSLRHPRRASPFPGRNHGGVHRRHQGGNPPSAGATSHQRAAVAAPLPFSRARSTREYAAAYSIAGMRTLTLFSPGHGRRRGRASVAPGAADKVRLMPSFFLAIVAQFVIIAEEDVCAAERFGWGARGSSATFSRFGSSRPDEHGGPRVGRSSRRDFVARRTAPIPVNPKARTRFATWIAPADVR